MDAEAVAQIIANDLAENPHFFNAHEVDLQACLVPPTRLTFENSFREGELLTLWLVLREDPAKQEGYLVVFDESQNRFGLAVHGAQRPVFIGYYGSFTETLSGM
jgi:hypothetical protein